MSTLIFSKPSLVVSHFWATRPILQLRSPGVQRSINKRHRFLPNYVPCICKKNWGRHTNRYLKNDYNVCIKPKGWHEIEVFSCFSQSWPCCSKMFPQAKMKFTFFKLFSNERILKAKLLQFLSTCNYTIVHRVSSMSYFKLLNCSKKFNKTAIQCIVVGNWGLNELKFPFLGTEKQWRIQDFPQGVRQLPKLLLFFKFLPKIAWKWKNLYPGGAHPWRPPLDPPMENILKCK